MQKECYPRVDIHLDLISKVRGTEENSDFQFNHFKETDILRVDKLSVTNFGECNITDRVVHLNIRPQAGYKFKEKHPANYNDMHVPFPDINVNQTVTLVRNYSNSHYFVIDNKNTNITYRHWGYDLDEAGDWIVDISIKDRNDNRIPSSYNFRINEQDIKWFKVITLLEASLVENNTQIVVLTWALYVLTAVLAVLAFFSFFFSSKDGAAQIKELKNINIHLKKILNIEKISQKIRVKRYEKRKKIKK